MYRPQPRTPGISVPGGLRPRRRRGIPTHGIPGIKIAKLECEAPQGVTEPYAMTTGLTDPSQVPSGGPLVIGMLGSRPPVRACATSVFFYHCSH